MPPRPLSPRALAAVARLPDAAVETEWRRVLSRESADDAPLVSLLADWAAFSGFDEEEMLRRISRADDELAREFADRQPVAPDAVADLYAHTETLIPLLVHWHASDLNPARCAMAARQVMDAVGARRVLDFGCGIGSTALALSLAGCDVLLADVALGPLEFAQWRLRERGHAVTAIDLRSDSLDQLERPVQGVVAFDVFEHLPELGPALEALERVLEPGGAMCFNQVYVPAGEEPSHYPRRGEVLRWLHRRGYRLAHVPGVCWIAQKAPLRATARRRQAAALAARIAVGWLAERLARPLGRRLTTRLLAHALR